MSINKKIHSPFKEQPARFLLIDISSFNGEDLDVFCKSLSSTIRLNYFSDTYFPRIPALSIAIWSGSSFDYVCQLEDPIKHSVEVIKQVRSLQGFAPSASNTLPTPHQITDFLEELNILHGKTGTRPDISVFTKNELLAGVFSCIPFNMVSSSAPAVQIKMYIIDGDENSILSTEAANLSEELILTIERILNNPIVFDKVFRGWLHDHLVCVPSLQICLPTMNDKIIYCDVFDMLLSPCDLLLTGTKPSRMPVTILKPVNRLPSSEFESGRLYSNPQRVLPTSSWQMELEEIEQNFADFGRLCDTLSVRNEILICENIQVINQSSPLLYAFFAENGVGAISPMANSKHYIPAINNEFQQQFRNNATVDKLKNEILKLPNIEYWNPYIHAPRNEDVDDLLSKLEKKKYN